MWAVFGYGFGVYEEAFMKLKKLTATLLVLAMVASMALSGCGSTAIDSDAVVATINGKEITLGFMNFVARFEQAYTDQIYLSYFGTMTLTMWNTEYTEGEGTMEESTKAEVVENIRVMYLLEEHMEEYGVTLSDEELEAITEAATAFMEGNTKKALNQMGATQEYVEEILRLYTVQHKVGEAIYASFDIEISDEEAAQRTFSYIYVSATDGTDEDGNSYTYDDDEAAAFLAEMEALAELAAEDYDTAMDDYGFTVSTYSYGIDEEDCDEAIIEVADALAEGEVSGVITVDDYYYIIRLDSEYDEEATETRRAELLSDAQDEAYEELCQSYVDASDWTIDDDLWATVKFRRHFGFAEE